MIQIQAKGVDRITVMFHETIGNDDFKRNTVLQHCCDIVLNVYNIVPVLKLCVALKIVVANRHLEGALVITTATTTRTSKRQWVC